MIRVTVRERSDRENLQLCFTCPITGKPVTKSAGTTNEKEAERAAAAWELKLQEDNGERRIGWTVFLERYEDEHLSTRSESTFRNYNSTFREFESLIGVVKRIDQIDGSTCSKFAAKLRKSGSPETTIAKHLRQLGAALGWAEKMGMIPRRPSIIKPPTPKRNFRGRPLSLFEVCRILIATRDFLPADIAPDWIDTLKALWLTGLRIGEAHQMHHSVGPVQLDMSAKHPRMIFRVEGQKNNSDELVPLTSDAVRHFRQMGRTSGPALLFPGQRKERVGLQTAGRIISEIGEYSEIVTGSGKFASAHDFRRSFGSRWALRVHPIILKILMRHEDLSTTLKYYVDLDCDSVAAELMRSYRQSRSLHEALF